MVIVLLSSTATMSFVTLHRALEFYGYLDSTRWDAVRWITNNTPRNASIAAYPEALGWWIEAEAKRNTATVTDRDTVPYVFLRERSLAAERVLSRNQGPRERQSPPGNHLSLQRRTRPTCARGLRRRLLP